LGYNQYNLVQCFSWGWLGMQEFYKQYISWAFDRLPEGYMSWQHLLTVSIAFALVVFLAIFFGRKNKTKSRSEKLKVVMVAAIVLDSVEVLKLIVSVIITKDIAILLGYLPLFLCSIPLIVLPVAAFSKGRIQQATLDFMVMFGLLGGLLGTYLAGNIYSIFPVIHFFTLNSLITHMTSAFAALYIAISGLHSFEKRNILISIGILGFFMIVAESVNLLNTGYQSNYMFLSSGDGTPFTIIESVFPAHTVGYAVSVALCMWIYLIGFSLIVLMIQKRKKIV